MQQNQVFTIQHDLSLFIGTIQATEWRTTDTILSITEVQIIYYGISYCQITGPTEMILSVQNLRMNWIKK